MNQSTLSLQKSPLPVGYVETLLFQPQRQTRINANQNDSDCRKLGAMDDKNRRGPNDYGCEERINV